MVNVTCRSVIDGFRCVYTEHHKRQVCFISILRSFAVLNYMITLLKSMISGRCNNSLDCWLGVTQLTHWGHWVTHICVGNINIIGSDNGLPPSRRQAIMWINARILLIRPLGTNCSEILIKIISFNKMHLNVSSKKWRPFCLGVNVLINMQYQTHGRGKG